MEIGEKQDRIRSVRSRLIHASDLLEWAKGELRRIGIATERDHVLSAESKLISSIDYLDDALNDVDHELTAPDDAPTP